MSRCLKSIKNIRKIIIYKNGSSGKIRPSWKEAESSSWAWNTIFGSGWRHHVKVPEDEKQLLIGVSSVRGAAQQMKRVMATLWARREVKIVESGDKIRSIRHRTPSDRFVLTCQEMGRKHPTFRDVSVIALELLNSRHAFDEGPIISDSGLSSPTRQKKSASFPLLPIIASAESMSIQGDTDADVLQNHQEHRLANLICSSVKESTISESSARMTAMGNASKNASWLDQQIDFDFQLHLPSCHHQGVDGNISGAVVLG